MVVSHLTLECAVYCLRGSAKTENEIVPFKNLVSQGWLTIRKIYYVVQHNKQMKDKMYYSLNRSRRII